MQIAQGPHYLDASLVFTVTTHRFDTGVLTDADSVPSYRVYEAETGTAILTGSMAKLDDTNTTGFYSEEITLSAANGFEAGKSYSIYVTATVNSVVGGDSGGFTMSSRDLLGIVDIGTAQSATATSLVLRSGAAFADDELIGATVLITGGSAGVGQRAIITDYVGSTDTATVPTWPTTPTGTITYVIFASAPAEGVAQTGDAYAIVSHGTYGNSALQTDISAVGTNATAIKAVTDNLPDSGALTSLATAASVADLPTNAELATALVSQDGPALPSGTVVSDAGNSATVFVTDRTETTTDYWKDALCLITSGVLAGQVKKITAYNGTTKAVTVENGFTGIPAADVTFMLVNR